MDREMLANRPFSTRTSCSPAAWGTSSSPSGSWPSSKGGWTRTSRELEAAVQAEDVDVVVRVVHRIKGALSANVAAHDLRQRAAEIEQLGESDASPRSRGGSTSCAADDAGLPSVPRCQAHSPTPTPGYS